MEVLYGSTRSRGTSVTASQAILQGLSHDGGLFVPDHIPVLDKSLQELAGMDYRQTAYEVMKLFLTDFTISSESLVLGLCIPGVSIKTYCISPLVSIPFIFVRVV